MPTPADIGRHSPSKRTVQTAAIPHERTPEDPDQTHFDADVDLRDVQIAARHADPRTTMRYDRARKHLDRHPNYILASYMAAGTRVACGTHIGSCRPRVGWLIFQSSIL